MTAQPDRAQTVGEIHDAEGFRGATSTIRNWVNGETIDAAALVRELRYWLTYMGG